MTKGLTAMLEPVMLIVLGGVIYVVVLILCLPIFSAFTSSAGR